MATAVITFVYNEAVNLPIWQKYYGRIFGGENLFIIDHGSSDGSTGLVGRANKILLPRTELDEHKRCVYMADFHKALLNYFDTVIYTDCDEILVPDLSEYQNLADYVDRSDFEYIAPIGLDVQHIISIEPAIDLKKPILGQRRFCRFKTSMCKPLLTRTPLVWATGFHACNRPVRIDQKLFMFHLKTMDQGIALQRQKLTREMAWSASSIAANHGAHARYDDERFMREFFLDPDNMVVNHGLVPFDFSPEIGRVLGESSRHDEFYFPPDFVGGIAEIPWRLRGAF